MTRSRVLVTMIVALVGTPTLGSAAVTVVPPGTGTLQAAIDAASPGDVLVLRPGDRFDPGTYYRGPVTITKKLKLVALRAYGSPADQIFARIDAECASAAAVDIAADDVQLRGILILGGTTHGLRIVGRSGIRLGGTGSRGQVSVTNTCNAPGPGIEIDAVGDLKGDSVASGDFPVGTRIANLAVGARVRMVRSAGDVRATTGLLLANIAPGTLRLKRCQAAFPIDAGILLQNADGVLVERCVIFGSSTSRGIVADADSDDNQITRNEFRDNLVDVVDDGTSNCWKANFDPDGPLSGNPSTLGCP